MNTRIAQCLAWGAKNSPHILKWAAVGGVVAGSIVSGKQAIKAHYILQELNEEKQEADMRPPTKGEIIKETWKTYAPVVIINGLTIAAIIYGDHIHTKRNMALAAAYALSQNTLTEFKARAKQYIGEKKTTKITDDIVKEKIEKNPPKNNEIYITEKGNTLFYDTLSGRYFESDIEKIKQAVNELNKDMLTDMYMSLNDFYYAIGLKGTELGNDLGWNINEEGLIDIGYSAQLTEDDRPCIALVYSVSPRYNYGQLP